MEMHAEIKKASQTMEFETDERCYITEIANDVCDEAVSIARARVKPGITTARHKLVNITERYLIISGQGKMEIGNLEPVMVCMGDVVRIPMDTPQRITNTGTTDLIFYAICSPRFKSEAYISLE
jgi:mannose-6-phosphate isomerase-like protein (cupin superfamily)